MRQVIPLPNSNETRRRPEGGAEVLSERSELKTRASPCGSAEVLSERSELRTRASPCGKTSFLSGIGIPLALALLSIYQPLAADPVTHEAVSVTVAKEGANIVVDCSMRTDVTPKEAWAVLTDFNRMADFVPNVHSSAIVGFNGNVLRVQQKGAAKHGILSFSFESLRDMELTPYSVIKSRAVGGTVAHMEGLTQLTPDPDGTVIHFRSVSQPGFWVPPWVGTGFVKHEITEQFTGMLEEMQRRKRAANKPS